MAVKSKVLIYDVENAANIGLYFGRSYDAQIGKVIQSTFVFGFAYKWLGEKKTHSCYIWDFPLYKKDPKNDIKVIKKWAELMEQAEVVVGHNSDSFDNKVMMGRLIYHRLPPVHLPQSFDTKKAIKRVARYDSNKLDDLGEYFGIGRKVKHDGMDMWWGCMTGDKKYQKEMVTYNIQDVDLTERLYLLERTYAASHPNMSTIAGKPDICPKCGSDKGFQANGFRFTKSTKYQRFICKNCWSNVSHRVKSANEPPKYV